MNKVMKPVAMLISHKAEEYTTLYRLHSRTVELISLPSSDPRPPSGGCSFEIQNYAQVNPRGEKHRFNELGQTLPRVACAKRGRRGRKEDFDGGAVMSPTSEYCLPLPGGHKLVRGCPTAPDGGRISIRRGEVGEDILLPSSQPPLARTSPGAGIEFYCAVIRQTKHDDSTRLPCTLVSGSCAAKEELFAGGSPVRTRTQCDENNARQLRALRLEVMGHLLHVVVSPLLLPRFSASNAVKALFRREPSCAVLVITRVPASESRTLTVADTNFLIGPARLEDTIMTTEKNAVGFLRRAIHDVAGADICSRLQADQKLVFCDDQQQCICGNSGEPEQQFIYAAQELQRALAAARGSTCLVNGVYTAAVFTTQLFSPREDDFRRSPNGDKSPNLATLLPSSRYRIDKHTETKCRGGSFHVAVLILRSAGNGPCARLAAKSFLVGRAAGWRPDGQYRRNLVLIGSLMQQTVFSQRRAANGQRKDARMARRRQPCDDQTFPREVYSTPTQRSNQTRGRGPALIGQVGRKSTRHCKQCLVSGDSSTPLARPPIVVRTSRILETILPSHCHFPLAAPGLLVHDRLTRTHDVPRQSACSYLGPPVFRENIHAKARLQRPVAYVTPTLGVRDSLAGTYNAWQLNSANYKTIVAGVTHLPDWLWETAWRLIGYFVMRVFSRWPGCHYQALIGEPCSDILMVSDANSLACSTGVRSTSAASFTLRCRHSKATEFAVVHDKVSTLETNLRKKSLAMQACILMGALSDIRPVQLVTMDGTLYRGGGIGEESAMAFVRDPSQHSPGVISENHGTEIRVAGPGIEPGSSRMRDHCATSLGEPGSIPGQVTPGFTQVGFVPDDAVGQRVFSEISQPPKSLHTLSLNDIGYGEEIRTEKITSQLHLKSLELMRAHCRGDGAAMERSGEWNVNTSRKPAAHQQRPSSFPQAEIPSVTPPGVEPDLFRWEAGSQTTRPPRRQIDVKHVHTEDDFAIGWQFIRHALYDSEPISDFQGNKCHTARCFVGSPHICYITPERKHTSETTASRSKKRDQVYDRLRYEHCVCWRTTAFRREERRRIVYMELTQISRTGFASGFPHVGLVPDDTAGQRVFLGYLLFPLPKHSHAAPLSPYFTLIGSQDLDVKSRPNLSTELPPLVLFSFSSIIKEWSVDHDVACGQPIANVQSNAGFTTTRQSDKISPTLKKTFHQPMRSKVTPTNAALTKVDSISTFVGRRTGRPRLAVEKKPLT
ncbi:hypothetical protein PR048_007088 [Dryococelus australis]|uniref:Uncharacterized protein n=1 Tax=Dryococelus australis TaxID=614101 RepID=A0ABQ9ICQ0_9NEOP|nr:hypothetical protein PR048_007088 [Dryococelus australis]